MCTVVWKSMVLSASIRAVSEYILNLHNKTGILEYFLFLVGMLQVKMKFRLKFFNPSWFFKYYLCLLALILMIITAILRIINLNLFLTLTDICKPLKKCNLATYVNNIRQKCIQKIQCQKNKTDGFYWQVIHKQSVPPSEGCQTPSEGFHLQVKSKHLLL